MSEPNASPPSPLPAPLSWAAAAEHCLSLDDLTAYQRESARRALHYLGEVLGDEIWTDHHPLKSYIHNYAPWTRIALSSFAADLQTVGGAPRFDTLLTRLRAPERWSEGFTVTRLAARLVAEHFAVEFDPSVNVYGTPKMPDLLITNDEVGDQIYVEIATLGASKAEEESSRTFHILTELFWAQRDLEFAGRMLRVPSQQLLDHMQRRIAQAISLARSTNRMQLVEMPHALELAVAPKSDTEFLRKWMEEHKVQGFSGPPVSPDTTNRIKGKLRNEQKQLPRDALGAIVLDVPYGFFRWEKGADDHESNLRDFGEMIAEFPHLLSVVLRSESLSFSPEREHFHCEGQTHAKLSLRPPFSEELFFLTNKSCKLKLAPATMTAWSRAYLQ